MSKKPKIAIFHCGFIYTGGGERIVMEEVLGLRKRGFEVACFAPTFDSALAYPDTINNIGVKTFLPQLPAWFPLRFAVSLVGTCLLAPILAFRFRDFDIFLGANQPGAFLAWVIAGILRKPYLVYLNQPNRVLYPRDEENWQNVSDYYFLNNVINRFFRPLVFILDKKSILGAKKILINGNFVAREIVKIYKPTKWCDCPAGAKPAPQEVLQNERWQGEIKVDGLKIKKPYLLLTSRHEPWKRFDWAIKTVKTVVQKFPQIKLVIPGASTSETPRLKKLASDLGLKDKIVFTGPINQKSLCELYSHACLFTFPSPKEDLGIVVEEAQAYGVPVVAWKAGGPTVTVRDGKTGLLAKPYELSDFSKKIIFLLAHKNLAGKMGEKARKHIESNFSWEKHLDILEKEIKKTLP